MDKSVLKALIYAKGQELGFDQATMDQMMNTPIRKTTAQQQAELNLAQDKIKGELDINKSLLDLQEEQNKQKKQKDDEEALYNQGKEGKASYEYILKTNPQVADRLIKEGVNLKTSADLQNEQKVQQGKIKKQQDDQQAVNIIDRLNKLKLDIGKSPGDALNPASATGAALQTRKNILSQLMGKMIEKNRMSDADRKFYLDQVSPQPLDLMIPGRYESRIQGVIDEISGVQGVYGSNTQKKGSSGGTQIDSLRKKYNY